MSIHVYLDLEEIGNLARAALERLEKAIRAADPATAVSAICDAETCLWRILRKVEEHRVDIEHAKYQLEFEAELLRAILEGARGDRA